MNTTDLNASQLLDALRCGAAHTGRPALAGLYTPQHEITLSPYPMGPPTSPFIFGGACTCQQWLWMPNTLPKTLEAVAVHYTEVAMVAAAHQPEPEGNHS